MRRHLLWLACLSLAACRITAFEHAPIIAEACDPQLTGRWLSVGDGPGSDGEVELRIDRDCRLQVAEHEHGGLRRGDSTMLQVGRHAGHRYVWADAGWALRRFAAELDGQAAQLQPGDVYLLRYRIQGGQLTVQSPDSVGIAHRIIDGDIPGEVLHADSRLFNRITGDPQAGLLERGDLFNPETIAFRRADADMP